MKLYSKGFSDQATQIQLIKDIFAEDKVLRKKILDAILKGGQKEWVIFAEQPLLNLTKLILQHAKKRDGNLVHPKDVGQVGKWLLILSDVCMPSERQSVIISVDMERERLREFMARQHFFMAKERLPYRLARFKDLFTKIDKLYPGFNISNKFAKATGGILLDDYLSFCFFLLVNWVNKTTREPDITKEWIVCKGKYFEQTALTKKEIEKIADILLVDVKNFSSNYEKAVKEVLGGEDFYPYNFLQLRQRPLIPYSKECFVCPSPDFLMDKASEGIYWILENHFKKERDKMDRELLPSVCGDAFEEYIHERFEGGFAKNYHRNVTQDKNEWLDGAIDGMLVIFCIETKYAHWTYKGKLTGKKEDLLPTLKQLFSGSNKVKGLGQLSRAIKKIDGGKLTLPFARKDRKIVPILVVGEGMPMDAYNRKLYEDISKEAGSFYGNNGTSPFIILDAEEVEMLEAIAIKKGQDIAEKLLIQYSEIFSRRNEIGYVREAMEFKNYLHSINFPVPGNEKILKMFDAIANSAQKKGFPKSKRNFKTRIQTKTEKINSATP